ncbi:hypothetical protein [Micromonospora sp. NBC_01796]|uniref:hypothetical protein n=1 Tax=Micromonospora sp. NBC_01796 TaxID=2975987 RepID=UPI002DDB4CED|nr:hypothetical protein [Micromonospora sp. NBC_01796]WSA85679.1 hypothetical protein OIE47_35935 [Micromonospora sp. NBC_01796]
MTNPELPHQATGSDQFRAAPAPPGAYPDGSTNGGPAPVHRVSSATRHLSAGAYLDDRFRRASLNQVYHQVRRLVAPSYGYDVITVLDHCLRAAKMANIRDAIIVGLLVISFCAAPFAALAALNVLLFIHLGVATWRVLRKTAVEMQSDKPSSGLAVLGRILTLFLQYTVATIALMVLSLPFILSSLAAGEDIEETYAANTFLTLGVFILLPLLIAVPVAMSAWRQWHLDRLAPGQPIATTAPSPRFDEIHRQGGGNVVIYAGYWPFIGSGNILKSWGFAQRLVRGADPLGRHRPEAEREFEQPPFKAQDIIEYVRDHLRGLIGTANPEQQLPGLTVSDRVFLAGTEASRLVPYLPQEQVDQVVRYPTAPARHYLVCQVVSWHGELVTTVYVHFAVQGKSLYTELTSMALPPCNERYRIVDQVDGTGPTAYVKGILGGIVGSPLTVALAPFNLIRAGYDSLVASFARTSAPAAGELALGYDYGANSSVREMGTAPDTRNHTQSQDIVKYQRVIERRVLAAILDFLQSRGVDTSEYRQRAMTLLSAGAVVTGSGSINVYGDAIGTQQQEGAAPAPVPGAGA